METKICKTCGDNIELSLFPREMRNGVFYYPPHCKKCMSLRKKDAVIVYRFKNKEKLDAGKKTWYENNKEIVKKRTSNYRKNNRDMYNTNLRNRRKNDPIFQLRDNVRVIIRLMINKNYGSKNGSSINDFLPYSIEELKQHLENQFEPWMTWNNYGKYISIIWDDNDPSTWTWQLDHIIPQSDLPYKSMIDNNFKECWALINLRPYSSKLNSIEGANRKRHKGNK